MPNRQIAEAEWVDRFLNRLGTIAPSVHSAGANERAFQTYADAGDLGPEEAAEIYALELPPGGTSTPET
jgi:hypothetical protein